MIFFEMVTKDELLWRVQFVRSEIDEEIENSFWSASDQDNLRVSLLPYSTQLYSSVTGVDNDNRLVYKPQLTQCKPVKYFKIQLFAIAKKCPQLDVGFSGHNRTIKFKGHQIWPVVSTVYLDFEAFLRELKLNRAEYCTLDDIDQRIFRMVNWNDDSASNYHSILCYIVESPQVIMAFKEMFSYVEAPFWEVVKLCAIRNATEESRAKYRECSVPTPRVNEDVKDGFSHPASLLLFETVSNNKNATKLFAGIAFNENLRQHIFSVAGEHNNPWNEWTNYPLSETDMKRDGDYLYKNISPLSSILNIMNDSYFLLEGSMNTDLVDALSVLNGLFHDIWGSEILAGDRSGSKAMEFALAMALMSFSDPALSKSLLNNSQLAELLTEVTEEQIAKTATLVRNLSLFKSQLPLLVEKRNEVIEQENKQIEAENEKIAAHNRLIEAECAAIAAQFEDVFAGMKL